MSRSERLLSELASMGIEVSSSPERPVRERVVLAEETNAPVPAPELSAIVDVLIAMQSSMHALQESVDELRDVVVNSSQFDARYGSDDDDEDYEEDYDDYEEDFDYAESPVASSVVSDSVRPSSTAEEGMGDYLGLGSLNLKKKPELIDEGVQAEE